MSYEPKFMQLAESEAESNILTHQGSPFGCVITKNGQLVAEGHNRVLITNDPTAHGEITTIRVACAELKTHDLSGCELYTTGYPCAMCLGAIIWANIKTVYYGNTPQDAAKIGFRDQFIYDFIQGGMQNKDVLALTQKDHDLTIRSFNDFAADQNKTLY
ncbi:guanine deaminase [Lactobacillus selangorensis]|uniref:Guanine deaminase n=1 Tax=Lactobacillus selangorensis TaxID=81857 RepID=A0A0R2G902_9LACO|nr:nucleoside deaminase [Lactobacillus selangorensis]KRN29683.1 guanine deaminase [Lactobacillus selangorensis]KRN33788.1 guanine deaminase [Lactobacillus selangorensis]